jgi:hypothetical protein
MKPSERQRRILDWLTKEQPYQGYLFESALHLWAQEGIPCRARLLAHAYRELCSGLANVNGQSSRTDILGLVDQVVGEVRVLGLGVDVTPALGMDPRPPSSEPILIPWKVVRAVRKLVDGRTADPKGAARAQAMFDRYYARAVTPDAEISPSASRWHKMNNQFVGCCHNREDADTDLIGILRGEVEFLEVTLDTFSQGAVDNLNGLDEILAQANA